MSSRSSGRLRLEPLIEKLDVVEIINRHAGKRNQGVSVGEYLVIAAVSRALLALSKRATARWFSGTILARLYPHIEDNHLTSQRFWDHMDKVPPMPLPLSRRTSRPGSSPSSTSIWVSWSTTPPTSSPG